MRGQFARQNKRLPYGGGLGNDLESSSLHAKLEIPAKLGRGLQRGIDYTRVGLRPCFVLRQNEFQLAKVKCGVDVVTVDVLFNPGKLVSKSLAILVVLLDVRSGLGNDSVFPIIIPDNYLCGVT
jgi:hypothetical protein